MSVWVSRRRFVQEAALLGGTAAFAGLVGPEAIAAATSGQVRLGLASYTFRQFSRAQLIGFVELLRVNSLNVKDVKDHLPMAPALEQEAVDAYRAAGIGIHAVGAVYFPKAEEADVRAKFDYCRRAGANVIVAGDPAPSLLPMLERFVKEYNIRIAIHNHGPEDPIWKSPMDVLAAVKGMDPRMGCCIDVGHTVRSGTDVVEAIHAAGPRLFNVHMKDLTDFHEKESQVAVGEGKMPVRAIFEALETIGYPGYVDLEYEVHGDDPMPGVTTSFATMRSVLAAMS